MISYFHGSILKQAYRGQLLFLIYINDLSVSQQMPSFLLMFHFFSVDDNVDWSATKLKNDLSKITVWANQWKVTFNPNPKLCYTSTVSKTFGCLYGQQIALS